MGIANHVSRINLWKHCKEDARNVRKVIEVLVGKSFKSHTEVLLKKGMDKNARLLCFDQLIVLSSSIVSLRDT